MALNVTGIVLVEVNEVCVEGKGGVSEEEGARRCELMREVGFTRSWCMSTQVANGVRRAYASYTSMERTGPL